MKLNAEQARWSRRYQVALGQYLKQGPKARLAPATALGRQAVALGLETLDVAGIHERALLTIAKKEGPPKAAVIARSKKFFLEALVPIEKTHHAALKTERQVKIVAEKLRLRTKESSEAARSLERGIAKRKEAEAVLKESGSELAKLLLESSRLQGRLRQKTRNKLLTKEGVNRYASRQLQNEIAQTLLAIHLRLLTLKISTKASMDRLKKEIATNQTLVKQSARTIQRLAHEIDHHHEK